MAEVTKYQLVPNNNNIVTDFRSHFSLFRNRKSTAFVYGVIFVFIAFSIFLAFSPSSSPSSPSSWFINIFTLNNTSPPNFTDESLRSPFSSDFPPNSSQIHETNNSRSQNNAASQAPISDNLQNLTETQLPPDKVGDFESDYNINNTNFNTPEKPSNQNSPIIPQISPQIPPLSPDKVENFDSNFTNSSTPEKPSNQKNSTKKSSNDGSNTVSGETQKQGNQKKSMVDSLVDCDLYDGEWVRDDSYPLYKPGSCKIVDEQFNCILNGRPDTDYQKLKWKPKEFFVAPFLVQQWEVKEKDGTTKETLRLDLVVRDSDHFKYADIVIFNTGKIIIKKEAMSITIGCPGGVSKSHNYLGEMD
ncbi:Protein trichome birefringence [Bienertia sinuspersici]